MAPKKRENQFFNVGVQGRKTGVTIEDTGVRDEHGMEPISGIFSSPEKAPPSRATRRRTGGTVTTSESMDIDENSILEVDTIQINHHALRSNRPNLPPPKARSPIKTALGSSPRRQSSVVPKSQRRNIDTVNRGALQPTINRLLDFSQESASLQEISALSGSGQRRGRPRDPYSIEPSPIRATSAALEESLQEEIIANIEEEESGMMNGFSDDSFSGGVGNDSMAGAEMTILEASEDAEDSAADVEPVKPTTRRGKKRKSEVIESGTEEEVVAPKARRKATSVAKPAAKKGRKAAQEPAPKSQKRPGRQKRFSEVTEEEPSAIDESALIVEPHAPAPAKPRGRPLPKKKTQSQVDPEKENVDAAVFKKPKPLPKPKTKQKLIVETNKDHGTAGKLVDTLGNELSKEDVELMSTTSTASRFGRGRSLSVFRQMDLDETARATVGKTGRHRVAPLSFWKNERALYNREGDMQSIVVNESLEVKGQKRTGRTRAGKRALNTIDEDNEDELEEWETEEGTYQGIYRVFDPASETTLDEEASDTIAWAEKGIKPREVQDAQFNFVKLASTPNSYFSWGMIELPVAGSKRTKNSRRMHMVFHVVRGAVSIRVAENELTVHKGGVWQVPRGNPYSITNVADIESRIFFAQAMEIPAELED